MKSMRLCAALGVIWTYSGNYRNKICRLVRLPAAESSQKTIIPMSTVSLHRCLPPFSVNSKGGLPEMDKNNKC